MGAERGAGGGAGSKASRPGAGWKASGRGPGAEVSVMSVNVIGAAAGGGAVARAKCGVDGG